jgi:predicted esterase
VKNERIGVPIPPTVADVRERFETWLASAVPHESDLWLCGFSNGGVFAGQLLLSRLERYRGAIFLCTPFVLPPWPRNRLQAHRIFLARGTRDAVVPREFYICSDHYLRGESGAHVVMRTYDSGHEITSAMASEAGAWFSESLAQ